MAAFCRERGVALRPHAKTHKSVEIARKQLEADAVGICCATIGEAERLTDGGIGNLLITSPIVTQPKLAAAGRAARAGRRPDGGGRPASTRSTARRHRRRCAAALAVLVDLGVGRRRTGCTSSAAALAVARRIAGSNSLAFGGVQAYAGHLQHIPELAERRRQGALEDVMVSEVLDGLAADRIPVPRVSGAGTGTHAIDAAGGLFSELQCGSYVFLDVDYVRVALGTTGHGRSARAVRADRGDQRQRGGPGHDRRRAQGVRDRRPAAGDPPRRA